MKSVLLVNDSSVALTTNAFQYKNKRSHNNALSGIWIAITFFFEVIMWKPCPFYTHMLKLRVIWIDEAVKRCKQHSSRIAILPRAIQKYSVKVINAIIDWVWWDFKVLQQQSNIQILLK